MFEKGMFKVGKRGIPVWIMVMLLILASAGAAVGTVLSGKVVGEMPVTVSQALLVGKPAAQTTDLTNLSDAAPQSVDLLDGSDDNKISPIDKPDRSIGTKSDDETAFQFAAEIDTGDYYVFYVPLKNASNQDMVAQLTLSFPAGFSVEAMSVDQANTTLTAHTKNMTRTGLNTWKFIVDKDADKRGADDAIYIVVAASDTIAPGFYTIEGKIEQIGY